MTKFSLLIAISILKQLNTKFRVRHIPTLLLIRKGEILDTLVKPKKVEAFDEFVQKALKEI